MSEAYGIVVLKVNKEVEDALYKSDGRIEQDTIIDLLNGAKLKGKEIANKFYQERIENTVIEIDLKRGLSLEGKPKRAKGYIGLPMFGSEWIGFSYFLAKYAKGIEIYASMSDEYGSRFRFGLNETGKMFKKEKDKWKQYVPKNVIDSFQDL